jgi:hypothetical protein
MVELMAWGPPGMDGPDHNILLTYDAGGDRTKSPIDRSRCISRFREFGCPAAEQLGGLWAWTGRAGDVAGG